MSNFTELEYKYRADNIKFADFRKLMEKFDIVKQKDISSWDFYYTTKEKPGFVRFRDSPVGPELTRKIKTLDGNNFNRLEVDLPLDRAKLNLATVDKFMETMGYSENFRIYKNCFIYWLDSVNFVYYTVFDKDLKEAGRFIEVEVNKEKVNGLIDPIFELNSYAQQLETLGLSPQNRMKKSLFELFVK